MTDVALLKDVLAVPTKSGYEGKMIAWLIRYCDRKRLKCEIDPKGNLYVTKGEPPGGYYPCVCAHMDTVHQPEEIEVVQEGDRLIAVDLDRHQCGLGGDDKAGIFICLQLLESAAALKAAFFVEEEIGYRGSDECWRDWFDDVGYVMEFDSPCENIMTYTCNGLQLFPDTGPFSDRLVEVVTAFGVTKWQHHPWTDVFALKSKFDFPCLNLPAGYFHFHRRQEYVLISAVENSIGLGKTLLDAFGCQLWPFRYQDAAEQRPAFPVTYLVTHG